MACSTTTIMLYTIALSICSAIWQIYQINLYKNVTLYSSSGNALFDAIYLAYYYHIEIPFGIKLGFSESGRVHSLANAHLTADVVWIFVSIIALAVQSRKNSAYAVNILWMCTAIIELIIDGTSIGLFAKDAYNWQGTDYWGIVTIQSRPDEFISGAILMAIISSRFVILLLINVCMFFGMVSITNALKKPPVRGVQQYQYRKQQAPLV